MAAASSERSTLDGRRVVITRAPEQSTELIRRLVESGAEVLPLPMVRFAEPQERRPWTARSRRLATPVLADSTGSFLPALTLSRLRCDAAGIWVTGPFLRKSRLPPSDQPRAMRSKSKACPRTSCRRSSMVPAWYRKLHIHAAGKHVLLPRSDLASAELPTGLRAAGARVTEVVAYCTIGCEPTGSYQSADTACGSAESASPGATAIRALRDGNADAVTFFSPSAFHQFARLFGLEFLRDIGARAAFAAIGPATAAAIRASGLQVAVEAESSTAASLVAALENYFARQLLQKGEFS